jgi:hypothetical protein
LLERRFSAIFCLSILIFVIVIFPSTFMLRASAQAPAPGKPLPPGPMQAKVKASCTSCHNTTRITEQHLTRQQWAAELEKMESLGAVVPDADREGFFRYLAKNFGPAKGAAKN